jgi:hypothetical protein
MSRAQVAVVSATPETAVEDILRAWAVSGGDQGSEPTTLVLDLEWNRWQPGTGTTPWQLDAALRILEANRAPIGVEVGLADGIEARRACRRHGLEDLLAGRGLLPGPAVVTRRYDPPRRLPALEDCFTGGCRVPEATIGTPVLYLPVWKDLHGLGPVPSLALQAREFVGLDAAREGGRAAEVLAEAAALAAEIHPRRRVLVDGTAWGRGSGPRRVRPSIQNLILVGDDPVACDATLCRLQGVDPMRVPALALCHERGLGAVRPEEITLRGEDLPAPLSTIADLPPGEAGVAARVLRHRLARPVRRLSRDLLWYPLAGRRWRRLYDRTPWGRLHRDYRRGGARA